jgi:hypothetical protein
LPTQKQEAKKQLCGFAFGSEARVVLAMAVRSERNQAVVSLLG